LPCSIWRSIASSEAATWRSQGEDVAPTGYTVERALRAVQLLLGHTKIESTVRYLGIEVDDAFAIAEQIDV
jgi:hypothetical protein